MVGETARRIEAGIRALSRQTVERGRPLPENQYPQLLLPEKGQSAPREQGAHNAQRDSLRTGRHGTVPRERKGH